MTKEIVQDFLPSKNFQIIVIDINIYISVFFFFIDMYLYNAYLCRPAISKDGDSNSSNMDEDSCSSTGEYNAYFCRLIGCFIACKFYIVVFFLTDPYMVACFSYLLQLECYIFF